MYALLFYFFIAALQTVNGKYTPVCQPKSSSDNSAPKLPTFPSAFSTSVQVNIMNKNYTALYKEFYDLEANKGSLERTKDGKTRRHIYDYNLNERIFIDLDAKNCSVSSINGSRFNFFGNNNSHIESVSQLFRFAKQYNEEYMGVVSVRGIRCNHWRACINVQNYSISYYLDYYFSVPGWKTTWPNTTVVRAVINGTRAARPPGGADYHFYHVYDFYNFRPGSPDPSNFQLPGGYYCMGLKGENKTVPKVPSVFSMEFESVWSRNNSNYTVSSWQEVYDFEKKLALLKHPNWYNVKAGPVVLIYDFNTGFLYNISTGISGPACKVVILTDKTDRWFGASDGDHHIRLKTTQELFNTPQTNGSTPLIYKGSASVRGVATDIWVGKASGVSRRTNQSYETVMEWYFSKPSWRFMAGSQNNEHQVPVRVDWYSQRGHFVTNLFNFDAEAAEATAFDIKPCFKWEEQRFIQFAFEDGKYDKYGGSRKFLLSITKAISTAANVSIIRVNGIRLQDSKGGMVVTFILLNKTKPVGGKVEVTVYPEKDLMKALEALKNSVQSGKFMVEFQKKKIYAAKSSFFVGFRTTPLPPEGSTAKPSDQPNPGGKSKIKTKGVSSGAVAGISFLMLAVGIGGGLLIAHFIMKRRGTSLFSYQRQE